MNVEQVGELAQAATVDSHGSLFSLVLAAGPVGLTVLAILLTMSVISWTVIFAKYVQFRRARRHTEEFNTLFWEVRSLDRLEDSARRFEASPLSYVYRVGFRELQNGIQAGDPDIPIVERSLKHAEQQQGRRLEYGMTFLATVASSAPFIGLFGTVWGIMKAFQGLGMAKATTIQAVAPGIAEALVATAVGLAAAIPAVIAYNYCAVSLRQFREAMHTFSLDFLNLARRYV